MESWMEKYEKKQDLEREKELNYRLELLQNEFEKAESLTNKQKYRMLQDILEVYKSLRLEAFNYNEEDYLRKTKELTLIKNKILEQMHREEKEALSWEEYKKEEMEEER